jgi:hypothetical protein
MCVALALFALFYAASFYFRIYVVDTPLGVQGFGPVAAALRQAVLWGQLHSVLGAASLAAGALAFLLGGRALVWAWSALTAVALSNYNVDLGSMGLALGLLRVVRM